VQGLLDKRLIFVTGKGGVGKSTVSIALGLLAARAGRRCIVAELAAQERIQRAFDHHGEHFEEVEIAPGLFTISWASRPLSRYWYSVCRPIASVTLHVTGTISVETEIDPAEEGAPPGAETVVRTV